MTRRLTISALALAAACGRAPSSDPAPLDTFYRPTGMAAVQPAGGGASVLVVASSNSDLLYDVQEGGALTAIDPSTDPAALRGATRIPSFAGEVAVAPAGECGIGRTLVLVASRADRALYPIPVGDTGALSCEGCGVPLSGPFADPFAIGVACAPGVRPRAFVAYLRGESSVGWITEYDLETGALRNGAVAPGPVRGIAHDAARDRLYLTAFATSIPTPLRWVDLAGECDLTVSTEAGGCLRGNVRTTGFPVGIELRGIALGHPAPGFPRRVYLTARRYDLDTAATAGTRITDYAGLLLVADVVDDATGAPTLRLERALDIGLAASDVRVLPARAGKRDVVAALATGDGTLWIYDDDTDALAVVATDPGTGAPLLGHEPFGLAVDPQVHDGGLDGLVARVYVGSFADSFVTPVDVPLDAPERAAVVSPGGAIRRISGGTP
jgi:hypothetical protein